MNRKLGLILTILVSLTLAACSKPKPPKEEPTSQAPVKTQPTGPQTVYGTAYTADQLRALGIFGDPRDEKVVLFEYNSSEIDRRSQVILQAHAAYLAKRAGTRVTLEGHADERGTRDYNLALGERRSNAAARFLSAQGAGSNNQTISYGEERPVDTAHTEAAWTKNRRVEIKY